MENSFSEQRRLNQQDQFWDNASLTLIPDSEATWGIAPDVLAMALALTDPSGEQMTNPAETISFSRFERLLKILAAAKLLPGDLNAAIRQAYEHLQQEKPDSGLVRLMQVLALFFPPGNPGPVSMSPDLTFWNLSADRVLEYLLVQLQLARANDSRRLADRLEDIAGRRVKVNVADHAIRRTVSASAFLELGSAADAAVILTVNRDSLDVRSRGSKRPFLNIKNVFSDVKSARRSIEQPVRWFALLKMDTAEQSQILVEATDRDTDEVLLTDVPAADFPLEVSRQVQIPPDAVAIHFTLPEPPGRSGVPVLLLFTQDGKFQRVEATFGQNIQGQPLVSTDLKNIREELTATRSIFEDGIEANYLKLTIVGRAAYERDIATAKNPEALFHALFNLSAEDLLATTTIGIGKSTAAQPFRNQWILVAGTGYRELTAKEAWFSEAIGKSLAEQGWGLVIGGWPGVDELAARSFKKALEKQGVPAAGRIIQLTQSNQKVIYDYGKVEIVHGDWFEQCSQLILALIGIGGKGGTRSTLESALLKNIEILPVAATGGDAEAFFQELNKGKGYFNKSLANLLGEQAESKEEAERIATALVDKLDHARSVSRFRRRWVLIAGSGNLPLPEPERWLSELLGRRLAAKGYGLICGGWPGVDEVTARAFNDYLRRHDIPAKGRLLQLLEPDQQEFFNFGDVERTEKDWNTEAVNRAGVMIMIGGLGGTYQLFRQAQEARLPVIPIAATGRDARKAFEDLTRRNAEQMRLLQGLNAEVDTIPKAEQAAAEVMTLLDYLLTPPRKAASRDDFREMVEQIYQERPVEDPEDLQLGRWGGRPERNGYALSAKVFADNTPGNFRMTIQLRSLSGTSLNGQVAFFLHDSFAEPIRYANARKGLAELKVTAYEAFTVGAMTGDGTTLELDLNNVRGFPPAFYYHEVSSSFARSVERLIEQTPVRLKDDLQKFRWGGRYESNAKRLQASVRSGQYPSDFYVTIQIAAAGKEKPGGEAAFFLYDSFPQEVRFQRFNDGVAEIRVRAYEAFTVGAMTSDGTLLELDLQRQTGFPEKFYYADQRTAADGFYKVQGIRDLVAYLLEAEPAAGKNAAPLLIFRSASERIWAVTVRNELLLIQDDRTANDPAAMILGRCSKKNAYPLSYGSRGDAGTVSFGNPPLTVRYSYNLFKGQTDLGPRLQELLGKEQQQKAPKTDKIKKKKK